MFLRVLKVEFNKPRVVVVQILSTVSQLTTSNISEGWKPNNRLILILYGIKAVIIDTDVLLSMSVSIITALIIE